MPTVDEELGLLGPFDARSGAYEDTSGWKKVPDPSHETRRLVATCQWLRLIEQPAAGRSGPGVRGEPSRPTRGMERFNGMGAQRAAEPRAPVDLDPTGAGPSWRSSEQWRECRRKA